MWLVVGLGNPGPRYLRTRHNFGWLAVAALAESEKLRWREVSKFKGLFAEWSGKAALLLPLTYMNLSGEAVAPTLETLALSPERLLVLYDDLDLPLGRLKLAPKGGSGGHRGVASIIGALGTEDFPRLRLGIGRPLAGIAVRDYVLSEFTLEERPVVEKVLEVAVEAVRTVIEAGLPKAMTLYNRKDLLQNGKEG